MCGTWLRFEENPPAFVVMWGSYLWIQQGHHRCYSSLLHCLQTQFGFLWEQRRERMDKFWKDYQVFEWALSRAFHHSRCQTWWYRQYKCNVCPHVFRRDAARLVDCCAIHGRRFCDSIPSICRQMGNPSCPDLEQRLRRLPVDHR